MKVLVITHGAKPSPNKILVDWLISSNEFDAVGVKWYQEVDWGVGPEACDAVVLGASEAEVLWMRILGKLRNVGCSAGSPCPCLASVEACSCYARPTVAPGWKV